MISGNIFGKIVRCGLPFIQSLFVAVMSEQGYIDLCIIWLYSLGTYRQTHYAQGNKGEQKKDPSRPMELTPEQARELLNRLNKEDRDAIPKKEKGKSVVDTPRPW